MRPGSRTKVSVPLVLPQNRHPERSASQIYRVIQSLVARSRRTSTALISPMLFGAFQPRDCIKVGGGTLWVVLSGRRFPPRT